MATFENVSTHDLKDGDVIHRYGMRIQITGPGKVTNHPTNEYSPTLWWDGQILNIGEVRDTGYIPRSWIGDGRWTIQGNGLARWTVERA